MENVLSVTTVLLINLNLSILAYKQIDSILTKRKAQKAASQFTDFLLMKIKAHEDKAKEIKETVDKWGRLKQD